MFEAAYGADQALESDARCAIVIPARLAATRLPGKPLLELGGRALILHVVARCQAVPGVDDVVVATPDIEIARCVEGAGFRAVLTDDAATGTHRVALAAAQLSAELIINVQGDQPLIDPSDVAGLVRALRRGATVVTGRAPLAWGDRHRPEVVKVTGQVLAADFDRSWEPGAARHIGLYGFHREALARAVSFPTSERGRRLGLEQLAWLEGGLDIALVDLPGPASAIDTREQLAAMREGWSQRTAVLPALATLAAIPSKSPTL